MKERIPQKTLQVSSKKADAILLSVAVIWGWGFIAGKIALETAPPQWILFFRFSIAAICILALFFKQIKNADKACVRWGILIGLLQFAALFVQLFALQYTTTAKQSFLAATYVLFTPFAARILYRKKILPKNYIASLLALAGIAFLRHSGIAFAIYCLAPVMERNKNMIPESRMITRPA